MKALALALALLPALAWGKESPLAAPKPGLWELSLREGSPDSRERPSRVTQRQCLGPQVAGMEQGPAAPADAAAEDDDPDAQACRVRRSQRQGDTVKFAVDCPGPVATRTEGFITVQPEKVTSRATTVISQPGEEKARVWHEFTARRLGDCPEVEIR